MRKLTLSPTPTKLFAGTLAMLASVICLASPLGLAEHYARVGTQMTTTVTVVAQTADADAGGQPA